MALAHVLAAISRPIRDTERCGATPPSQDQRRSGRCSENCIRFLKSPCAWHGVAAVTSFLRTGSNLASTVAPCSCARPLGGHWFTGTPQAKGPDPAPMPRNGLTGEMRPLTHWRPSRRRSSRDRGSVCVARRLWRCGPRRICCVSTSRWLSVSKCIYACRRMPAKNVP